MPRPINFGCRVEDKIYLSQILPSLINKSKKATIRQLKNGEGPRYHIGDIVKFAWKPATTKIWFCAKCGCPVKSLIREKDKMIGRCPFHGNIDTVFHRDLGRGLIQKVLTFTIEKKGKGKYIFNGDGLCESSEVAKIDGFRNSNDMYEWLNGFCGLKDKKRFAQYQWIWLDDREKIYDELK